MASRDGLCRYDGNHFKVFQPSTDGRPGISSSSLFGLNLDHQGKIWIFSDHNDIDVIDPVRETFTNFSRHSFFKRSFGQESDIIDAHYLDRQGHLWISFLSDKVACIDVATHQVRQYQRPSIPGYFPTFSTFVQDKQGVMWMANLSGLYRLDTITNRFVQYALPANDIRGVRVRPNGQLLILSEHFIFLLNPQTNFIKTFPIHSSIDPLAATDWHHTSIVADSQENEYFNQYNILFRFSEDKGVAELTRLPKLTRFRSLFIDRSDVLWAGTDRSGVLKYNLKANVFKALAYQKDFYHDLLIQNLGIPINQLPVIDKEALAYNFRYTIDKNGKLWFNMGTNRFYLVDLQARQITPIPFPFPGRSHYAWTDPVAPMATDPSGKIWVVTDSVAMYYEGNRWQPFRFPIRAHAISKGQGGMSSQPPKLEGYILQLVVDEHYLWVATRSNGLYRVDRVTGKIQQYTYRPNNLTSLSSNQLFCLFDDPADKNILWVGTFGSGLCRFNKQTGSCQRFSTNNGLPNNVVYAAIPDRQGFLWIATNQGICRMNRRTFQTRIYTHEDGLLADEFNRFHFLHLPDDRIILGGLEGITSFHPSQLREDEYQPQMQITDIQINNQPLLPGALTDSLPAQAISHLDLAYDQNFVTVSFAGMQYNRQAKIRYRYKLIGLNKAWIETNRPIAEYTDLRSGHYKLLLNASNTSGMWSKHIRELTLIIRPPWWATWWAILFYVIIVLSIVYSLIQAFISRQEAKQLKAIDAIKERFYTNITHEFRTPLTLILAPVEQLKQRLHNANDQHQLELISQNATQLLGLVNQLMELSKAEANVLRIKESQTDLVEFLNRLIHSFESQASAKGIQVSFRTQGIDTDYWFDTEKLERIVYNLLANALKFTPVGGKVVVHLTTRNSYESREPSEERNETSSLVHLEISDNGIGIASDKLPHIFERFYQIDDSRINHSDGAGIGLALVKELVELQHGTIRVESKESIGTTFYIDLPYRPATVAIVTKQPEPEVTPSSAIDQEVISEEVPSDDSPVILVVEDNEALSDFIADSLPETYRIHRAKDGGEGWKKALAIGPDLVISDVLMPVMDGYTLCQQLKKDQRTSHIPVILLTAKASINSKLEGLSSGADDYIAKPFYVQELQLRIHNLLEQRRQLRKWVLAGMTNPDAFAIAPSTADPLVEKLCQLIEQHLDDAAFGVEELIQASGMSRMNLHRKLKALVDLSTGEFIRNYRLKRAAQLLRQGHPVAETAYLVGFEDPSYFARSFRKLYQTTPSAFSRQN
ncbi:response regulator [Spirosoma sp. KNUC1025]|nr:response regulator [Spirosoma sp. KNUC1025]